MIMKTQKYIDFNGVEREEEHYFHLTKAELMELELGAVGGLSQSIREIMSTQDIPVIMDLFKKIIQKSYGKKSPDGRSFMKSQEILDSYIYTEAYSELFTTLATNAAEASAFIEGIIPKNLNANTPSTTQNSN